MSYRPFLLLISILFINLGLFSCKSSELKEAEGLFYDDVRSIVKEITGDAENLDKLVKQLKEIREEARRDRRSVKYTLMDPGK